MGPVGVVVSLWGLRARLAEDWEGAGWYGPLILCCREVLVNAEVYLISYSQQVDPWRGGKAHVRAHEAQRKGWPLHL